VSRRLKPLARLAGDQLRASNPADHAALSASAGTGKTHVLTARVLRLLLSGVDPSSILCLTFTKAGAAEMADRIHARLAYWVRLKDSELASELAALGERVDPIMRERARTLFARVLDAAGGGLRIQTIHAFAQGLLAAFPTEAGLIPGFRPLDGREEQLLARQTLANLLVEAERGGDLPLVRDLQALSHRLGEGGAEGFLMQCARASQAMEALGPREGIEARLRRVFDLPAGDIEEAIATACADDAFDIAALRRIGLLNGQWGTKGGLERADICAAWLAASPSARAEMLERLHSVWARGDGERRSFGKGQAPQDEDYAALAGSAFDCCARLLAMRRLALFIAAAAAGLRVGQSFAVAYSEAKRANGVVDFDDLIRWTEALLSEPGMGDWVRYKLDQNTDHILVDEAQDTNARQWSIVGALTEEFFAGEGAVGRHRTIFTVGDFKQAIFRFQGTDPREFDRARSYFREAAEELRAAARELGPEVEAIPADFLDLSMDRSFRSAPPILRLVDRVIADLGHAALGLPQEPNPHESHHRHRPGSVVLWQAFGDDSAITEDAGEEGWISDTVRRYAGTIAKQIRHWIEHPFEIGEVGKRRPVRPEDILILVRRRSTLASLIVARLHAEGVPVAGVDRLLLSAPLAVQDLLAAARFALQPLDDLNLASLLVSPLLGWTQEDLFAHAHGRDGPLWPHLRGRAEALPSATMESLQAMLAMADYAGPHLFFETLLSERGGRCALLERLGSEARDPIEELLASALEFETTTGASLQRFLDWFARGDVEIVRDPSAPMDAVRVMTVHGSKGLQAPVVILADATVDPERSRNGGAELILERGGPATPILRPRKDEQAEPLKSQIEEQAKLDREEHWRLLYVAMTRAEDRLYVGGSLGPADRNGPPAASWYRAIETSLDALDGAWREDPLWLRRRLFGDAEVPARNGRGKPPEPSVSLPEWIARAAPVEARPPRPLAPSSLGEDDVANPPPGPAMRAAAERGRLLHTLFERLPAVPTERRPEVADAWLAHSAGVSDPAVRGEMTSLACSILSDPAFATFFEGEALVEAPVAAVIADGTVVTGTIDRLLVTEDAIRLIDFKTGRAVPDAPERIPVPHLRQMAAYVAALDVIFPGRRIDAALLYTSGPTVHRLSSALLRAYLPGAETSPG
jgi:ATP-dependent helicase/nuclease subunit A